MANRYDLLISGGLVVGGSGIRKADVGIKGEQIHAVEPEIPPQEASRVIKRPREVCDAGVIDVHVHPVYEDNIKDLSFTAAHGGTTTLIHFAYAKPG